MGMLRIKVDNVVVDYFKADTDVNRTDRLIREKFGGTKDLTLVVEVDCTLQHRECFLLCTIHVEDFVRIVYERWGENQFVLMC